MSFIQMSGSFADVQEKQPVPDGTYDLVIASAEVGTSQSDKPQVVVGIEIEGHDDAPQVRHYLSLPAAGDDADKVGTKMLMIKRFLEAFSIPYEESGFNVEDFFGAKATLRLTLTDPDDNSNGNVYNRLQLPRLESEAPVAKRAVGSKKA